MSDNSGDMSDLEFYLIIIIIILVLCVFVLGFSYYTKKQDFEDENKRLETRLETNRETLQSALQFHEMEMQQRDDLKKKFDTLTDRFQYLQRENSVYEASNNGLRVKLIDNKHKILALESKLQELGGELDDDAKDEKKDSVVPASAPITTAPISSTIHTSTMTETNVVEDDISDIE